VEVFRDTFPELGKLTDGAGKEIVASREP